MPHIIFYFINKKILDYELPRYDKKTRSCGLKTFVEIMVKQKVFRNHFYYRIGRKASFLISWLYPGESTLNISTTRIGRGLHFEHNYACIINAQRIGENFNCLQLVTIGVDKNHKRPVIGNNVTIWTGACVFGDIVIGDNVNIGANTVINKNVPNNCTVVGNPARIVRLNGEKVNIRL